MTNEELTMSNEEAKEIIIQERDSLKANPAVKVENCLYEAFDVAIKALEQQPCEDCISREAVFEQINDWQKDEFLSVTNPLYYLHKRINSLPSVTSQQKATGSWVEKQVVDNEEVEIEQWQSARCSKCDKYHTTPYAYFFYDYNYCPICGARMEVDG